MSDSDDENIMEDSGIKKDLQVAPTIIKPATIPKKITL